MSDKVLKEFEAAFGVWTTTGYFKHKPTQHQLDGFRKGYAIAEQASADRIAQLEKALAAQNHIPDAGKMASQHLDDIAVDRFAEAMKTKLAKKREQGRGGWETATPEFLSKLLLEHITKRDPVDVANFCMMLFCNGSSIVQVTEVSSNSSELPNSSTGNAVTALLSSEPLCIVCGSNIHICNHNCCQPDWGDDPLGKCTARCFDFPNCKCTGLEP